MHEAVHEAGGVGQVGGAFAVEERQHDRGAAGLGGLPVQAEEGGETVDGLRAVEGAGQGQPPAPRVGEAGDDAAGVRGPLPADGVDGAGGAEAEHRAARFQAEAQGAGHVVAGARGDEDAGGQGQSLRHRAGGLPGSDDAGQQFGVEADVPEDVLVVALGRGGPPPAARDVAAVGRAAPHALTGQPAGQVVVGEPDGPGGGGGLRLVLAQPRPLRHGERGRRHAARAPRPLRGPAELVDQPVALRGGPGVVPQQCVAHRAAVRVERDQTVLLPGDRDGGGLLGGGAALAEGLGQRTPPLFGIAVVLLGHHVRRLSTRHDRAGGGIHHQRLGGLRGTVHADDEGSIRCSHERGPL